MDRRHFLNATMAGIATTTCPLCASQANAQEGSGALGYADEEQLCGARSSALKVTEYSRTHTTGNKNLDQSLISELRKQAKLFQLVPAFYLFTNKVKNAFATTRKFPDNPKSDGSILYGITLMNSQLEMGYWGGAVVAGVMAHEYGHIYQYHSGAFKKLRKLHKTVKFVELHADFMSGYYMGIKYVASGKKVNVRTVASATYDIGDYAYNNPAHHGTPVERTVMLKEGFETHKRNQNLNINQVSNAGFRAIEKIYFR